MPLTIKAINAVEAQLKITNELLQTLIDIQRPKEEVVSDKEDLKEDSNVTIDDFLGENTNTTGKQRGNRRGNSQL